MGFAMLQGCLLLLALSTCVNAYMHYQAQIPNGDYIPHPCKPNFVWKGVGHLNQAGGGERNQFGKDFAAAGKKWTKDLCGKDSDGDGKSNGVELGDPKCIWIPNTVPELTTGITHPGVCDPYGDPKCITKNDWVKCGGDEFNCPAIKEEGVFTKELRFPYSNVPAEETSYMCVSFDLPTDDDYHLIATTPIINESRVMHHIALLSCDDTADDITEPTNCVMGLKGCTTSMGLWTLGLPGECFYKEAGVRVGTKGFKKAALQFHWTNPEKKTDLWDSSGMTLYFTKNLRKFDSGTWSTGQVYLEIPPLSPKVVQHSTCTSECTRNQINGSIFLTTGLNHMHYLGIGEYVKLKRADGTELMLTDEKKYSYDTPILHIYDPPIEIKPGDSLETVCTYKSMSRKTTAIFGAGTFDEMCFGIFNYYPTYGMRSSSGTCVTRKDFDYCGFDEWGCDFIAMMNFSNPETRAVVDKIMGACSHLGECLHGCREVITEVKSGHACFMKGRAENVMYTVLQQKADNDTIDALKFVNAMKSCDCVSENPIDYIEDEDENKFKPVGVSFQVTASIVLISLSLFLFLL